MESSFPISGRDLESWFNEHGVPDQKGMPFYVHMKGEKRIVRPPTREEYEKQRG